MQFSLWRKQQWPSYWVVASLSCGNTGFSAINDTKNERGCWNAVRVGMMHPKACVFNEASGHNGILRHLTIRYPSNRTIDGYFNFLQAYGYVVIY